ncbi:hypothetical protein GQ457_04G035160 [Hibiscus cannabinus]
MEPSTKQSELLEIEELLQEFRDVFATPTGLPPIRDTDHALHLEPGAKPVNVKPYRYPYFQKREIEKQVEQMLSTQVIQRSSSPYSSPVLLVKKKDGTWRFCVDYRALNAVTVKDKFPIPTVDELFDELGEAMWFSKLDLLADDILVYSKDWQQHLKHLREVMQVLRANGLVAKRSKCTFGRDRVEYLGHIVSREGLIVDLEKTIYKGICNDRSTIIRFTKKGDGFEWNSCAQGAFEQLKERLCNTPVLALPRFNEPFFVETDASGVGIGVVLVQENRPIAYFSQKLSARMQGESTYNREMYAITQAVRKWRQYLLGRKFVIITDQKSLRELTAQTIQTPKQQRWLSRLIGYNFEIRYRPGKMNAAADALSRETSAVLMALTRTTWGIIEDIRKASEQDEALLHIRDQLQNRNSQYQDYDYQCGLVLHRGRIVVPNEIALRSLLLREYHESVSGGHAGMLRTFHRLSANFFWENMRREPCRGQPTQQITPLPLLLGNAEPHEQPPEANISSSNLEDKVLQLGGDNVMNGNNKMVRSLCEGENVMPQGNVETATGDDVQPNEGHATRRSVRERKLPTALTDFIL